MPNSKMPRHRHLFFYAFLILISSPPSSAELGKASHYNPPYIPTACFGRDFSQLPSDGYFAAVGDDLWNNGTACGKKYMVSCISSPFSRACKKEKTIQVRAVDRAKTAVSRSSQAGTTITLSRAAFEVISDIRSTWVAIQFKQV
ncbi:PREDICTED: EG45-like domain containing protein 2 isoform X1 [Ipomoea nil]|uniref:EG45-like domain containing protein 2 isoform X1 n=1 Tax=Ipomoea nil TaxID=35883 RepID=UPI0009018B51|nr:PREDICTED: EG45-like domain containing protein 2 isoform X1 [Ipomoea nil]